jgi:hypothetical protein
VSCGDTDGTGIVAPQSQGFEKLCTRNDVDTISQSERYLVPSFQNPNQW